MPDTDTSKPFFVMTDASLTATGGVLMQKDGNGDLHPCCYSSKMFSPAERNYDIYDRELLAVLCAFEEWRHYLTGTDQPVTVLTDHKNLCYFKDPRQLSRRQARWLLTLQDYDLLFQHVPGANMGPADALSRRDETDTSKDNADVVLLPGELFLSWIDTNLQAAIEESTRTDGFVIDQLKQLHGGASGIPRSSIHDWQYDNSILYFKNRAYVPEAHRNDLLHVIHDSPAGGHGGYYQTVNVVQRDYWWPGLTTYVRCFIQGCAVCQANKVNTHPTVPPLTPMLVASTRPFQCLSVDLITDLPPLHGYDSVMVVVDHGLTKGVIFTPTHKSADAVGIAQLFFKKVFPCFGLHDKVISDRSPQFASAFALELARLLQYDPLLSSAYHPQTDGETEQVNQELETYLQIFCQGDTT